MLNKINIKDFKDKKVYVHLNLTETKRLGEIVYSLKMPVKVSTNKKYKNLFYIYRPGKLIGHVLNEDFLIYNAVFSVNEIERLRIIKDKVKYVHAGVCGNIKLIDENFLNFSNQMNKKISYNPMYDKYFKINCKDSKVNIFYSNLVLLNKKGLFVSEGSYL